MPGTKMFEANSWGGFGEAKKANYFEYWSANLIAFGFKITVINDRFSWNFLNPPGAGS